MKKLLTKLSPIGMLMDDPDKLKYVSPIAMLLSSGNKDKDKDNKNQTNQVTRQTEQAKQQSFSNGKKIQKQKSNPKKNKEENKDTESPDYTRVPKELSVFKDTVKKASGGFIKTSPQVQGFGKARKPIR